MKLADRVKAVFDEAADIASPADRAAFLDRVCAGDDDLRRRVDRLLLRHVNAGSFLDRPAVAFCPDSFVDVGPITERPGTVIGPYKLLEKVGEGGMGTVWMAEQARPVRRKVALKVVKPGLDTAQVVARFEAERQALALMDHPNIAKVHDAGATDTGRPYFVMELVRGLSLTDYCDQARLTVRDRLALFATVCRAVQHAHQKGVIHRDLKPSNVLVTVIDGAPVPKVIDFGIAKATGGGLTDRTLVTGFHQLVGTPMYMSPEQAELSGVDVDTRSDVYALGVLLYELLTGTTPFDGDAFRTAGLDEVRRIIREQEPDRPSRRVSTLAAAQNSTIAERRKVDSRQLGEMMRSELDWIVMKALEKDRNRRYESAGALAADVERYLADEPVEACPPTAWYRVRKVVRRNRKWLATAGIVALALVIATAVSSWQAVRARDAQRQAEADRDQAKAAQAEAEEAKRRAATESAVATAIGEFLQQDLLQQADIYVQREDLLTPQRNFTVKEALDRASEKIDKRFRDQPLVEAAIRRTIGETYRSVGEYRPAVAHLERAVALYKTNVGAHHTDTIRSMYSLGDACRYVVRHSQMIALYQAIVESRKVVLGPDHPETLSSMGSLAVAYEYAGQLDVSVRLLEQLVEKCRTLFGPTHNLTLGNLHRLAWNYALSDRPTEATALLRGVHELYRSEKNSEQSPPASWHIWACQLAGDLDQADRLLRELVEYHRREQASLTKPNSMANNNMASALALRALNLLQQGRLDEAEPFAREAVGLNQSEEYQRFYSVSVLGAVLLGRRKYAEAERFLLQGYQGLTQTQAVHPLVRRWRTQVGEWVVRLYDETGQQEKARVWREKHRSSALRE